jgi:predicted  nucleic acid-binding Zn-ribbon protein
MSELTLKAIEQLLDTKLDEKLKPLKTGMANLATSEELQSTNTRLTTIEGTLNNHTTALANLATDVNKLLDEKTVSAERFERLEHWAHQVGEKIGVKLER